MSTPDPTMYAASTRANPEKLSPLSPLKRWKSASKSAPFEAADNLMSVVHLFPCSLDELTLPTFIHHRSDLVVGLLRVALIIRGEELQWASSVRARKLNPKYTQRGLSIGRK